MDLSFGDQDHNFVKKRNEEFLLIDESRSDRERCIVIENMEVLKQKKKQHQHQFIDFWPVEHPLEPFDDDHPIKCPLSSSPSIVNNEGRRVQEDQRRNSTSDCIMRKRTDFQATAAHSKQGGLLLVAAARETPVRAVRKRNHHALTSLAPSQDLTNSKMLHHKLDKF